MFSFMHNVYTCVHTCDWFEKNNTLLNGYILADLFKICLTTLQSHLVRGGGILEAIKSNLPSNEGFSFYNSTSN